MSWAFLCLFSGMRKPRPGKVTRTNQGHRARQRRGWEGKRPVRVLDCAFPLPVPVAAPTLASLSF